MLSSFARLSLSSVTPRIVPSFSTVLLPQINRTVSYLQHVNHKAPINFPMCSPLHTSCVVERARQSTRIKKRKQHLANKKKKEERLRKNPPPIPKKVKLMLIAKGLGSEPRPWRKPDRQPFPVDSAWCEMYHSWARLSVEEAIECLREHYHPTMVNIPDSLVWAKLEFNMQNVKKDKYLDSFSKMIPIYHPFERGVAEKVILAFCKTPEEMKAAEAAGANKVGGSDLIEDIVKGKFEVTDYDHFLATEEIAPELKPLLGILRDKFPKKNLGTVSADIGKLVQTFAHGMLVTVTKPKKTLGYVEDPAYAFSEIQVGRLNQPMHEIEGNLQTILQTLRENAPKRATGGFITKCELYGEGSLKTKFCIHHELVDDIRYKEHVKSIANSVYSDVNAVKKESQA